MGEPFSDDRITRDDVDAIGALANRHRLEILVALAAEAWNQQRQRATLTFSELHAAVDVESSSQFSYHLDQLVGRFVTETPDGYRLTDSGHKIVRTVVSGSYESTSGFDDRDVDGVCVLCEEPALVATRSDERFVVRCDACDSTLVTDNFPRSQTRDRTPAEIVASFGYRIWGSYVYLRGSVCPECFGPVETTIESHERQGKTLYTHRNSCRECLFTIHVPVEVAAAFHPTALHLLWDHGVSLLDRPLWEFFELIASDVIVTDVVSTDPTELTCTISLDDESRSFAVDETLQATPTAPTAD